MSMIRKAYGMIVAHGNEDYLQEKTKRNVGIKKICMLITLAVEAALM